MNINYFYGILDGLAIGGLVERTSNGIYASYRCKNDKIIKTEDSGQYIKVEKCKIDILDIDRVEYENNEVVIFFKSVMLGCI